jgi:hypothetical protein
VTRSSSNSFAPASTARLERKSIRLYPARSRDARVARAAGPPPRSATRRPTTGASDRKIRCDASRCATGACTRRKCDPPAHAATAGRTQPAAPRSERCDASLTSSSTPVRGGPVLSARCRACRFPICSLMVTMITVGCRAATLPLPLRYRSQCDRSVEDCSVACQPDSRERHRRRDAPPCTSVLSITEVRRSRRRGLRAPVALTGALRRDWW